MHGKQRDENAKGERHHIIGQTRVDDLQAFDGRQHRDGGRDHGIAEEEGCTNHAQHQNRAAFALGGGFHEIDERQDTAFALVVGAQQQHDIFEGDDNDERPDEQ